jgi:hypothetical protein
MPSGSLLAVREFDELQQYVLVDLADCRLVRLIWKRCFFRISDGSRSEGG